MMKEISKQPSPNFNCSKGLHPAPSPCGRGALKTALGKISLWGEGGGILFLVLFFIFGLLMGCGERQESAKYYYNPTWTRTGTVLCITGLQTTRKDFIGSTLGSSYAESVTSMTSAGSGDTFLFDATGAPPYGMSCSPAGDYLAYMGDLRNNTFGKIVIRNISSSAHKDLEKVEFTFTANIKAFDWSNDGTKIVYCNTQEVRMRNWNDFLGTTDTLITSESGMEFVSWQYGNRAIFVYTSGGNKVMSFVNPASGARQYFSAGASVSFPQVSSTNTNEVFGVAGGSYCKTDTSAATPATVEVKAGFKGALPRLSPTADKVVYSNSGEQSGIYILNLSTSEETQIK